jgi:hypothetical protein
MDPESRDLEMIEQYLHGTLDPAVLAEFEYRLENDHELARKLRLRKVFPSLFNAEGEDLIKQELTENPGEKIITTHSALSAGKILFWITILLVLAGLSGYLFYFMKNQPEKKEAPLVNTPVVSKDTGINRPTGSQPELPEQEAAEPATQLKDNIYEDPVVLEIPDDSAIFSRREEILFRWRLETDTFTNFFIISLADGKMVWWKGIRPGIREYKVSTSNFRPGRYYWYVGTRDTRRIIEISP